MKKLLLINVSANSGSTGRIAEEIGQAAQQHGYETYFAYGRIGRESTSKLIKIGNDLGVKEHGLESRLFDNHGFASRGATRKFIEEIERIQPDIVNIHNLHGYYINVEILFDYLATRHIPVVWTLHDCWPFTGHCAHFMRVGCEQWMSQCHNCPLKKAYPSAFIDKAARNFERKQRLFTSVENMTLVAPSTWMAENVRKSFLKAYPVMTINNGTDLKVFKPMPCEEARKKYAVEGKKVILGVASTWTKQKGLDDFVALDGMLGDEYKILLVGLNEAQMANLSKNIIGIRRTESVEELAELYSLADVFVNPTYIDNFPTTNIEALACGTPVITYKTGGSPEAIDGQTGMVVERGNIQQLKEAIEKICLEDLSVPCRQRAKARFDKEARFSDYINLFDNIKS